ncbi:RNA-binding S4 domain-containing protein [Pseudomonas sp. R2.Fl]|nr:RNA-binding S4 domain-containing protein [Pseudomonas sp. R2.Fl]
MAEERAGGARQRIDKWLFFARVVKSRSLAQAHIGAGQVKVNGLAIHQPSRGLALGDRVEVALERRDLILIVKGFGERRGPYEEARLLYEDLSPPPAERQPFTQLEQALRKPGSGRPTKRERRETDALHSRDADE